MFWAKTGDGSLGTHGDEYALFALICLVSADMSSERQKETAYQKLHRGKGEQLCLVGGWP